MFCYKCGKEIPEDSQFCPKCGNQTASATRPKSRKHVLIPVLVLIAIAALGFFGWQNYHRGPTTLPTYMQKTSATAPGSSPAAERALSGEEIYKTAANGMILIDTYDNSGQPHAQGSGFIVSPGLAITNYHVIRGASRATAKFGDGTSSDVAGVLGYDPSRDVAVVKLEISHGTALLLGNSDAVRVGQKVVAIGSPLGLQNTLSEGIVSGLRNGIIQMSDPISPGSSGGRYSTNTARLSESPWQPLLRAKT